MPQFLLAPRNVFVYNGATNPPKVVAGFHQFGHTTNVTAYRALDICFYRPDTRQYRLVSEAGTFVERDNNILPLGNYYVVSITDPAQYESVVLTQEQARWRTRSPAGTASARSSRFRERVATRDQRCVISGIDNSAYNYYGQQACHIIPRSHQEFWTNNNLARHLTDPDPTLGRTIDSVQNGLLLDIRIHYLWDNFGVSIIPDTNRVMFFKEGPDQQLYDGRPVQFNGTAENPVPPQAFLYEHFKQAVLANMKGAGKIPFLDYDPSEEGEGLSYLDCEEASKVLETVIWDKLGHRHVSDGDHGSDNGTLVD